MLIKKENSKFYVNFNCCKVYEFSFPYNKLGTARVIINGRYPMCGKGMNTGCDMSYYVIS